MRNSSSVHHAEVLLYHNLNHVPISRYLFFVGKKPHANGIQNAKDEKGIEGVKVLSENGTGNAPEFGNGIRAMQDNTEAEYILPEDVNRHHETGEDNADSYNEIVNYNNAMTRSSSNNDDASMKINIEDENSGKNDDSQSNDYNRARTSEDNSNKSTESIQDEKTSDVNSIETLKNEDQANQTNVDESNNNSTEGTNNMEKPRE